MPRKKSNQALKILVINTKFTKVENPEPKRIFRRWITMKVSIST